MKEQAKADSAFRYQNCQCPYLNVLKSSRSISNEKYTTDRHLKSGENKVSWNKKNAIIEKILLTDHNQRPYF